MSRWIRSPAALRRYREGRSTYSESERSISQTVGTQAKEQFVNLRFSDPYTDTMGTTHAVAYIERGPTAAIYRTLIVKDLDKAGDCAPGRGGGRSAPAFRPLRRLYQVSLNARRLISQLRIIHNRAPCCWSRTWTRLSPFPRSGRRGEQAGVSVGDCRG
jgi:hypothetical protein